jgi:hypothetical protein
MTPLSFSRAQLIRAASLTDADLAEIAHSRREHSRLGFAYQIGFVRGRVRWPASLKDTITRIWAVPCLPPRDTRPQQQRAAGTRP